MELSDSILRLLDSAGNLAVSFCAVVGFLLANECRKCIGDIAEKTEEIGKRLDEVSNGDHGTGDSDER